MDIAQEREAAGYNAKSFKNPEVDEFPLLKELKHGHHAIVVADQFMMLKTASSMRLNVITVAKLYHIAPVCKSKSVKNVPSSSQANKKPLGAKHRYQTEDREQIKWQLKWWTEATWWNGWTKLFTWRNFQTNLCRPYNEHDKELTMEIDTDTAVSLITEQTFRKLCPYYLYIYLTPFEDIHWRTHTIPAVSLIT